MDGVIVHAEHVYSNISVLGASVLTFIIAALIIGLTYIVFREFKDKDSSRWGHLVLAMMLAFIGTYAVATANISAREIHTNLIVTIDDSVRFNEFFEHYEVVSKNGNLYTVRELPIEYVKAGDNE